MSVRSGRFEKRIRLAIPVEISTLKGPSAIENTFTENACSLGVRVLTQRPKELDERLMVRSHVGQLRVVARVVYCQRLADGRFGVGMQFVGNGAKWRPDLWLA
jgi:hypothetical protein